MLHCLDITPSRSWQGFFPFTVFYFGTSDIHPTFIPAPSGFEDSLLNALAVSKKIGGPKVPVKSTCISLNYDTALPRSKDSPRDLTHTLTDRISPTSSDSQIYNICQLI